MGWMGKLTGGSIGMFLGGPLGALMGAAFGHTLFDRQESSSPGAHRLPPNETRQMAFFTAAFGMLGKMAKADGRVSQDEVLIVEGFMRENLGLDSRTRRAAISIFNAAKDDPTPFEAYARQFGQVFESDVHIRSWFYDLLVAMAMADGEIHPAEDRLLQEALGPLGLPRSAYENIRGAGGSAVGLKQHYAVLGVEEQASDDEIKSAYRKAVRDFHPDTIVSKGLPEEFTKFAEQKFQEVQTAYEAISSHRREKS